MRMQIRGEKCKSPFPSHLVSFDFCAFWKFVRFSQPLKKLEVERNMVRNWEKRCADFFSFFLSPAHSRPEVHFLFGADSNLAKTEDHLVPLHSARMSNRPIPMLPFYIRYIQNPTEKTKKNVLRDYIVRRANVF